MPFDGGFTSGGLDSNNDALPENARSALAVVEQFHQLRSGAATPTRNKAQHYHSEPPREYDRDVLQTLIALACNFLRGTFGLFSTFEAGQETRSELYAMAALGALHCSVPGSYQVAKALHHDARRLLNASIMPDDMWSFNSLALSTSLCKTV
jgi:hypothetical protein